MQSGIVSFCCRQVVTTLTPCVVTLPAEMYYLSNNTNIRLLPETNHAIKTADSSRHNILYTGTVVVCSERLLYRYQYSKTNLQPYAPFPIVLIIKSLINQVPRSVT